MPSFQTKAFTVRPIGGNNFGIIPINCRVTLANIFRQAEFPFVTKRYCILVVLLTRSDIAEVSFIASPFRPYLFKALLSLLIRITCNCDDHCTVNRQS